MCSYNKLHGIYSCENPETLNYHLRELMGFKGFVLSDWGGTHSSETALKAGLD